jgi:hypothetical protein
MGVPSHAVAVLALLLSSGCVATYQIPPAQLQYLNGYNIHGEQSADGATFTALPYRMISTQGQPVDYNSTKELILLGASQQQLAPPGPFEAILISEDTFHAVDLSGLPIEVPLKDIHAVQVTQPSPEETSQLVFLLTIVSTVLLSGIALAVH